LTSLLDLSKFDFFHIHMDFCNHVRIHGMKRNICYDMCNITTLISIFISCILLYNKVLFTLQKKIVKITVGAQP